MGLGNNACVCCGQYNNCFIYETVEWYLNESTEPVLIPGESTFTYRIEVLG